MGRMPTGWAGRRGNQRKAGTREDMTDPDGDPDADLLARIGMGEEAAFRTLMAHKLPRVHGLALRLLRDSALADDVAQEVFLRVWRQARAWRPGAARFDTWLHRVALNLCLDRLRRRREVAVAEPPDQVDPAPGADFMLARDAEARRVERAVAALPARQREALVMQVYQGLSNIEAAAALGISVEALESLLARARRALRQLLEDLRP